ncbi:MAG: hypothetical protein RLY69_1108 [Verrucomicrobiota bacterium]
MPAEVAFRFEGGGAALAGRSDGLAVVVIGDIAGGEESGCFGRCSAGSLNDVAVFVLVDEIAKKRAVWNMANGDKHTGDWEFRFFSADEVLQSHRAHFAFFVGEVFADG